MRTLSANYSARPRASGNFLTPAKRLHFAYDGPAPALEVDLPEGTESDYGKDSFQKFTHLAYRAE